MAQFPRRVYAEILSYNLIVILPKKGTMAAARRAAGRIVQEFSVGPMKPSVKVDNEFGFIQFRIVQLIPKVREGERLTLKRIKAIVNGSMGG